MQTEMGEYVVGAYLKLIKGCDFVDYNVRPKLGGIEGLAEMDVLGLDFGGSMAYLCEVTTHLDGLLYGDNDETLRKLASKFQRQRSFASSHLGTFRSTHYMFWSPVVPKGRLTTALAEFTDVELVINAQYKKAVEDLRTLARNITRDEGNPFFRALQILEHLRD